MANVQIGEASRPNPNAQTSSRSSRKYTLATTVPYSTTSARSPWHHHATRHRTSQFQILHTGQDRGVAHSRGRSTVLIPVPRVPQTLTGCQSGEQRGRLTPPPRPQARARPVLRVGAVRGSACAIASYTFAALEICWLWCVNEEFHTRISSESTRRSASPASAGPKHRRPAFRVL